MEQERGPEVFSPAGGSGRCGGVAASDWKQGDSVPAVRDRGGNRDPLGLRVWRKLWIAAIKLDLVRRVG